MHHHQRGQPAPRAHMSKQEAWLTPPRQMNSPFVPFWGRSRGALQVAQPCRFAGDNTDQSRGCGDGSQMHKCAHEQGGIVLYSGFGADLEINLWGPAASVPALKFSKQRGCRTLNEQSFELNTSTKPSRGLEQERGWDSDKVNSRMDFGWDSD